MKRYDEELRKDFEEGLLELLLYGRVKYKENQKIGELKYHNKKLIKKSTKYGPNW